MTVLFDPTKHVPDVNHWEGIVNFELFHPNRIVTKLSEGRNFGDPLAGYTLRQAREREIPSETFHLVTTWDDPTEQLRVYGAALFGAYCTDDPEHFGFDPIWLDLEGRSLSAAWRALGTFGIRKKLRPFTLALYRAAVAMQTTGTVGFYVGAWFWNAYIGPVNWAAEGLPQPRLWAPDYGWDHEGGGILSPRWIDRRTWPAGENRWQFTDRGRAAGVPGALDLNIERA